MMVRRSMFTGWYEFFKSKFGAKREFVSLDATKGYQDDRPTQFELLKVGSPTLVEDHETPNIHNVYEDKASIVHGHTSPTRPDRPYRKPTMSFSGPRSPSATAQHNPNSSEWPAGDEGWARGGLGSHPAPTTTSPSFRGRNNYDSKAG